MNQGVDSTQPAVYNPDHHHPHPSPAAAPPPHLSPSSSSSMMPVPDQTGYGGYHPQSSPHPLPPAGYGGHTPFPSMFEQKIAELTQGHIDSGSLFDSHGGMYGGVHSPGMEHGMSPPPPPRVYKPCVVCNDKSSGYHYGVSSCEGCKGFFRRSVQKNMQYTCHKDKNCPINKVTRNRCQYCRLHKCLAMGMSKEAVRNDRNKKRKPSKPESSVGNGGGCREELTEDDQLLIQDVLEAHKVTSPAHDNPANTCTPPHLSPTDQSGDKSSPVGFLWEKVTELSTAGIVKIVDFAKKMPGFLTLSTSDQITLLKAACLEIMILRICYCYDADKDMIQFSNGAWLTRDELQQGGFGPLTSTIFSFAGSLKSMKSDETEFALLAAICLISGDRSGLTDVEKIEQMQEPLLEALKHYIRSRRPEQPHIFAKMLMKMTDLRSISVKGEKQVLNFALDCISLILEPTKSKMQQHQQQQGFAGTPPLGGGWAAAEVKGDVLGPSGATATNLVPGSLFSGSGPHPHPHHNPASLTSFYGSGGASSSSISGGDSNSVDLVTMSPYQHPVSSSAPGHPQFPTEPLPPAYFLSYDMRQSSPHGGVGGGFGGALNSATSTSTPIPTDPHHPQDRHPHHLSHHHPFSAMLQRGRHYSGGEGAREGGGWGDSLGGGLQEHVTLSQKADTTSLVGSSPAGLLSSSSSSSTQRMDSGGNNIKRCGSLPPLMVKSESPSSSSSSLFAGSGGGDLDLGSHYDLRTAGGIQQGDFLLGDRDPLYSGHLYPPAPHASSSPAYFSPLTMRSLPPLLFGPSPPSHMDGGTNGSMTTQGAAVGWRGLEGGADEAGGRAVGVGGVMPVLHGPVLSPGESSGAGGQGREGGEREAFSSNPVSISQLIGGAMKLEPGDWINYDTH